MIAALSSGRWGASNLQAILRQGQVNDTWAYYQAKSIKQNEAQQSSDLVNALARGETPERAAALTALGAKLEDLANRQQQEKTEQQQRAVQFQIARDSLVESSFWFEISFTLVQLGVILCTLAPAARNKGPWFAGMVCGVLGLMILFNGFLRFYHAPKAWYQGASQQMGNDQ